jgi:hypothetical protein
MLSHYSGWFFELEFRGGEKNLLPGAQPIKYASGHQSRHQPHRSRRED